MYKLATDKKFTIILSAYRADCPALQNMVATEAMKHYIEHEVHAHAIRGIGVYNGAPEQCFIVHTNSSNILSCIERYAFDVCQQDAVLVSYNRRHKIQLRYFTTINEDIGTKFIHSDSVSKSVSSYFILNGTDYYTAR